jgi:hypothetical protein
VCELVTARQAVEYRDGPDVVKQLDDQQEQSQEGENEPSEQTNEEESAEASNEVLADSTPGEGMEAE